MKMIFVNIISTLKEINMNAIYTSVSAKAHGKICGWKCQDKFKF